MTERLSGPDFLRRVAHEVELLVSALDHMSCKGVSGHWQQRWPEQHRGIVSQIARARKLVRRIKEEAEVDG